MPKLGGGVDKGDDDNGGDDSTIIPNIAAQSATHASYSVGPSSNLGPNISYSEGCLYFLSPFREVLEQFIKLPRPFPSKSFPTSYLLIILSLDEATYGVVK